MAAADRYGVRSRLLPGVEYFNLNSLSKRGLGDPSRLPVTVKILLENALRHSQAAFAGEDDVEALARWSPAAPAQERERAFMPARVLLQDFTGVPAVVDLAALRQAMQDRGGEAAKIDPLIPVDLVVDHSVQVDAFGNAGAYNQNIEREYERNRERYELLRWAQQAFRNFRVVPPGMGIVHQVNLEYLASVVQTAESEGGRLAYPDTLVGTDSHTTMVNGIGVLGWGVGGIEAEACMLGQPLYLLTPVVVGVRFHNQLPPGTTATDLVLTLTQMLRRHGVVNKFVEFCGSGLSSMTSADRATLSNMAPEYGATASLFPVDAQTLQYLLETGRDPEHVALVERYCREQGMFRTDDGAIPEFSELLELDLATVTPSLAGPRRPQDLVPLPQVWRSFQEFQGETATPPQDAQTLGNGSVVIAAITSCTNTSNPSVMIAAGLLAKKALERGLRVPDYVKTSLAPGSRVVTDYLERAGLLEPLAQLRFNLVGYGCTTCIGNSGPLPETVAREVDAEDLAVVAVLSGNRNFEGRIHPQVKASYLASPPLVVAYALAGTVRRDLVAEPLGKADDGSDVYLRDLWPSADEVAAVMATAMGRDLFASEYSRIFAGDSHWQALASPQGPMFAWDAQSTYVQLPPFFNGDAVAATDIAGARCLALLGDSITTDHISPAGTIKRDSPAGAYLLAHGVDVRDFNSYGSRRGNHEVMMRGTFANVRLRNLLAAGKEGGYTKHIPSGEIMTIYDAAMRYAQESTPLVIIAGKEYGSGSSRDWAAKGPRLLGVRAVIAESYERIHRSNLVGMGVLPLQFLPGETASSLGLRGDEEYSISGIGNAGVGGEVHVTAQGAGGEINFVTRARLDSRVEVGYFHQGGVLNTVLAQLLPVAS